MAHSQFSSPEMCSRRRRLSLPPTPMGTPSNSIYFPQNGLIFASSNRRILPQQQFANFPPPPSLRPNHSMGSLLNHSHGSPEHRIHSDYRTQQHNPHARLSYPEIYSEPDFYSPPSYKPPFQHSPPLYMRRVLPAAKNSSGIARKLMKRCTNPDLMRHLQRTSEIREQSVGTRASCEPVDPVYLALKQATGRYSRRGSNFDSVSPSPRNLSQVSLQDSGYAETMSSSKVNPMLGSTPQLDDAGRSVGRRRAPKLTQQMKSLSLDCQDIPPRINGTANGTASGSTNNNNNNSTRSPLRGKLMPKEYRNKAALHHGSSDFSDIERSCSPIVKSRRSSSTALHAGGYIVIHEYTPSQGGPLTLGEKVHVVDNGDPDWLHGFRYNDRTEHLLTFPATCVAQMLPGEQAMRIQQNVLVAEQKLRMYRDQIVFVQPESLIEGKVTVRTEHNAYAMCPLTSLALL